MKIAIPIWDGRVSPVMDTAAHLLVIELERGQEIGRNLLVVPQSDIPQRAGFINGLGVDLLICGAISRQFELMISRLGIEVNPWVRGDIEQVIRAYSNGNLQNETFFLPGCGRRRRGGFGRGRRGRGQGLGNRKYYKEDI